VGRGETNRYKDEEIENIRGKDIMVPMTEIITETLSATVLQTVHRENEKQRYRDI
jgi:hypothetical protein